MAEAMIRRYAGERQRPMEVCSASVMGLKDQPAHKNAIKVMSDRIDLTPHRAQPVTRELMEWADYVPTMEIQHMKKLRKRYPEHENKLTLMGSFGGYMEINDPLGFWKGPFKICRASC